MNICITGALGHIGSHLIRNLDGLCVEKAYLIDNLLTQRYASLFDLPGGVNCRFYPLDIVSDDIEPIICDSEVVIHLAAITDAESSFKNAELVDKVNREGFKRVVDLCVKHNRNLVFFSTTSVYGSQSELVDENCPDSDLRPQSPYADSKLYAEKLLQKAGKDSGLKFVILRLGTIFGYSIGMRFHTAVNKFVWQAALGQEITVWKTALNHKRPYCGLNDCVSAIRHVMNKNIFDGQIYNIVTLNLTVKEIIDVIKENAPLLSVKFVDSPIMNQLSYTVSNNKSLARGFSYNDNLNNMIKEIFSKLVNINYEIRRK